MINAYVYLQVMSIRNAIVQRVRRLRQPKYLFGAIVGVAYFYFLVFRNAFRGNRYSGATQGVGMPLDFAPTLVAIAALVLLVVVLAAWIVPSGRAALRFSEAEVAFLFPAPISRRTLVHFKLLRSQFAILFSSLLMSVLFRRGSFMGGNPALHAAGWWLILSTLNLHLIGASFARERLLELGVNPVRRRAAIIGLSGLFAGACWWWLRSHVALPTSNDFANRTTIAAYVHSVLDTGPLAWVLAPFKAVVTPLFTNDSGNFFGAALIAVLILVAHYFWVVQSDVSFEEASIDVARRHAERVAAVRSGNLRFRNGPIKPRSVPFPLAPKGFASTAFLWKSLIALGPMYRLRTWVIACVVAIVGSIWLSADPQRLPLLKLIGGVALGFGGWLMLAGPMFMRRGINQTLTHLDVLKALPVRGWQIVLGELSSPVAVMTFAQWLFLLIAVLAFSAGRNIGVLTDANIGAGALGMAIVAPPLCGLMMCVPYAGLLLFPAWSEAAGSGGAGIEVMGQRMIFAGAYFLALLLALIPAALLGAIVFFIGLWLSGLPLAMGFAALVGSLVLCVEFAAAVRWLGERVENFDLSQEMPR